MFRYILFGILIIAAWPIFTFMRDGVKWLHRRMIGKAEKYHSEDLADEDEEEVSNFKGRLHPVRDVAHIDCSDYSSIEEMQPELGIDFDNKL